VPQTNRQVRLAARPSGLPRRGDWEFTSEAVPAPVPGEFVVEISHLSIDPAMRGWMSARPSYMPPVEIGAVMRAGAIGRVIASEHPGFAVGEHVYGTFGVQEYAVSDGRAARRTWRLVCGTGITYPERTPVPPKARVPAPWLTPCRKQVIEDPRITRPDSGPFPNK